MVRNKRLGCRATRDILQYRCIYFNGAFLIQEIAMVAAGLLGLVGYTLPVTAGLRWLPAASAGLLLATEPVWVMLLGRLFFGERGGARAWLGSAGAMAGVAVLAGPGAVSGVGGGYRALAGTGLVLAGTLSFAAYTIVLRPLSQELGAVPATAAATVVGSVPYLAAAGTLPAAGLGHLGAAVWAELAFLALGCTAPACCCGASPPSRGTSPGLASCSTWSRWSACWARRASWASG